MGRINGVETPCDDIEWCVECDYYDNCLPNKGHHKSNFVYAVYGETYYDGYGSSPCIFGIFDTLDEAMKFKEEKIEYLWENEQKNYASECRTKEDIIVEISVFKLNEPHEINVGGYIE